MTRSVAIALLACCSAALLAAPTGPSRPARGERPLVTSARPGAPDGLLVLGVLSPERAMVADPRSGAVRGRRLPGGTLCHGPVLGVGDRVVIGGVRASSPVALSLPLTLSGPARSLGAADTFATSSNDRVMLGRWTHRNSTRPRLGVREVDLDGRAGARAGTRLPRWSAMHAVLEDGAVLISRDQQLALWRRSDGVLEPIGDGWVIAAGRSTVAWCWPDCDRLRIWRRDARTTLAPPAGTRVELGGTAALAPDERHLAIALRTDGADRVGVVDVTTQRWTLIPRATPGGYHAFAWSPSGRWLYLTGRGHRVLGWRIGARKAIRLPIRTRGIVASIATVP